MAKRPDSKRRGKLTPARKLALELVREQRQRDAFMRELVDARRETTEVADEEFAYAQVLAFGVVMCAGTLDELINRNLNSPRDVRPKVRDALRISAYELLFLQKPAHVVVDQGVELARAVTPRAAGLANAVLRKMVADAKTFPWGDVDADDEALARKCGLPTWLTAAIVGQYGRISAQDLLGACLSPAPTYLVECAYGKHETFASDLSAQKVAELVDVDGSILEIGAGRGTKTLLLQNRALRETGAPANIHTLDIHEYRAELLEKRMREMGVPRVIAHAGDGRALDAVKSLPPSFDAVLVDAPCSGTGTLRRHPEIRWRLTPQDVESLAALQLELLEQAATRVRLGGSLVYATCSILNRENDEVVDAFLASDAAHGFSIEERFSSLPALDGPDGHFAIRLRKA